MKRFTAIAFFVSCLLSSVSWADNLELQQMKAALKQLEDVGVEIPVDLQNLLQMMEQEEQLSPTADDDNFYGKKLSDMSCSDDISGLWRTASDLTTLNLKPSGDALMLINESTGEYYTKVSMQWSSSGDEFYVDYDYVQTFDVKSDTLQKEIKPKNEIASCKYMGSMLKIGGQLYRR